MTSWFLIYDDPRKPSMDKAAAARSVAARLAADGVRLGGFVQQRVMRADGEIDGWDLETLDARASHPLARESCLPECCQWGFDPRGFAWAEALATEPHLEVCFVGSIGRVECAGRGHWPLVATLIGRSAGPLVVLTVRGGCLSTIVLRLPDPLADLALPAGASEVNTFAAAIQASLPPRVRR